MSIARNVALRDAEAECDRLRAENEELQAECDRLRAAILELGIEDGRLRDDRDRLRALLERAEDMLYRHGVAIPNEIRAALGGDDETT